MGSGVECVCVCLYLNYLGNINYLLTYLDNYAIIYLMFSLDTKCAFLDNFNIMCLKK